MKKLLIASLIALTPTVIFSLQPARAGDCNDFSSHIQTPNGKCYSLDYMTVVSASRSNTASAQQTFQSQFQANVTLETSESFRKKETEEERDERYRNLARTKRSLDKVVAINQDIESWAFTSHLRVLNAVDRQLLQSAPRKEVVSKLTSVSTLTQKNDAAFIVKYKELARRSFPDIAGNLLKVVNKHPDHKISYAKTTCNSLRGGITMKELDDQLAQRTIHDSQSLLKIVQADWAIVSLTAPKYYCPEFNRSQQ